MDGGRQERGVRQVDPAEYHTLGGPERAQREVHEHPECKPMPLQLTAARSALPRRVRRTPAPVSALGRGFVPGPPQGAGHDPRLVLLLHDADHDLIAAVLAPDLLDLSPPGAAEFLQIGAGGLLWPRCAAGCSAENRRRGLSRPFSWSRRGIAVRGGRRGAGTPPGRSGRESPRWASGRWVTADCPSHARGVCASRRCAARCGARQGC